ncbi:HesA/MoeB/ThiF family protein [Rhodoferax antarcticus]|uniref:Molybdopterin-synthase adenylyltransferase n=1 Tax=Rhodoferax antarcticus ANT.BR TaxID=1111071 RepID=A0A1Q8Y9S1_9BURK|nr:molybdopterin-synthase adenylyltransferase MoeB [Rhodoferax antarcticus]APW47279.1 molybdopterin biosynthesis protein MoeB [Rhodoferax antarcticus]MCW2312111.1 molybdopterin/thiamine biosynthesis adenylyltransferase [Rhodoferax antarcticus]OLP04719.1 UBA/THIF-type NAD/FAD binding protein [Rhodoferax antarcticus ANT.BR]
MHDDDLLRYSRHILLNEIGIEGQQRIGRARALIIGAGGLGSPVALYLSSAGVGHITVMDDDTVDLTNLQRQIAHTEARVGWPKVDSLTRAMSEINHQVQVRPIQARADATLLDELVAGADVVLDCSDNFATRHAINAACVAHHIPLVSGAAIRFDGQVCVYDQRDADSPCYACVFPPDERLEETRCATLGVFAPLVGIIGSLQAAEALKLICGVGQALTGRLLMLDGRSMRFTEMRIKRNPACPVCRSPTST